MYIKQCEGCKYYRDIDLGNKHLLGSRWSGYCSYHHKTARGQFRSISKITNCKMFRDKKENYNGSKRRSKDISSKNDL